MNCASHPDVETNLRCSKCGMPICPRCLVQTPVGARCPQCAHVSKLPTYQVPVKYYFRACGAALGMALVCGVAWGFLGKYIHTLLPILSFDLILAPAAGLAIGEVTSIAVNRKRSNLLAAIAGITMIICFLIAFLLTGSLRLNLYNILYDLLALGIGVFVCITRLR